MTNANEKRNITIVGINYASILTMVRDMAAVPGVSISVVRVFKKAPSKINLLSRMTPEAESRYVTDFHTCVMNDEPAKLGELLMSMAMIDAAGDEPGEGGKRLLIPVDDYPVWAIDACYDDLSQHYLIPNVNRTQNGVNLLMDKSIQKTLAEKAGVPVLPGRVIDCGEPADGSGSADCGEPADSGGVTELPDGVTYPCFLKPLISKDGSKLAMGTADNEEELKEKLERAKRTGTVKVLVESCARIESEYAALGIATPEGVVMPCVFTTLVPGHKQRKGVAVMGAASGDPDVKALIPALTKLMESTGYTGMFDIDLARTTAGRVVFMEINFRAGASVHLFSALGTNLPAMFAKYAFTGEAPAADGGSAEKGNGSAAEAAENGSDAEAAGSSIFVSEKALLEEYVRRDIDTKRFRKYFNGADVYFIKDEDDPAPYREFLKYAKRAGLFRKLYRVYDTVKK